MKQDPLSPEQLAKLPGWAKSHIHNLEYENRRLDDLFSALMGTESPISFSDSINERGYLPEYSTVRFMLDDKHYIDISLRQQYSLESDPKASRPDERFMEVRAGGGFRHRIVVIPEASNSLHVTTRY